MQRPTSALVTAAIGIAFAIAIFGSTGLTFAIVWGGLSPNINTESGFLIGPCIEACTGLALFFGSIGLLSARRSAPWVLRIYAALAILWTSFILLTLTAYLATGYRIGIPTEYWLPSFAAPIAFAFEVLGVSANEDPVLTVIGVIYLCWLAHSVFTLYITTFGPVADWLRDRPHS